MSKLPLLLTMPIITHHLTRPVLSLFRISKPYPQTHLPFPIPPCLKPTKFGPYYSTLQACSTSSKSKRSKKERYNSPDYVLKHKLDMCSKFNDLQKALLLYDEARANGVPLNSHHYNVLLYLCSNGVVEESDVGGESCDLGGLDRGFEIFRQMGIDKVEPNEATFTSLARLALAKNDPEMAFDLVVRMKSSGVSPKLRSYGPALFGFCSDGNADRAYDVLEHMIECGVVPEEDEIVALLKVSIECKRVEKVYDMLHRLRASVRQVSEETAKVVEQWFVSEIASEVGLENWDVGKVKGGVIRGGGGWHGQGWLGSGKWSVVKAEMDKNGVCNSCGEKLVCIDIDPNETEDFASKLSSLACQKEKKSNFLQFQEWLKRHGPFDAVVDGANVGLINSQKFSFRQLNDVVNKLQRMSPSGKLPLVILHRGRCFGGPAENLNNKRLLETWRNAGALYATPAGSNDDWYWLYAAVSSKCLMVTNDEMRDHLFQLLGNSIFPRWKEKHQVRMSVSRNGLVLHMPPPYSIVIQESEQGSWHVPTVTGDDVEVPRKWICATRAKRNSSRSQRALSKLFSAASHQG